MNEPLPGRPFEALPTDLAGLSLLDYFAARAAPALIALFASDRTSRAHDDVEELLAEVAFYSYRLASAMAAVREGA